MNATSRAIVAIFVRVVIFRKALIVIARARVITRKNQVLISNFHLYFIRMKIKAKARAKENSRDRKVGACSSSGVSSPNGRSFWVRIVSPVVWFISEDGE